MAAFWSAFVLQRIAGTRHMTYRGPVEAGCGISSFYLRTPDMQISKCVFPVYSPVSLYPTDTSDQLADASDEWVQCPDERGYPMKHTIRKAVAALTAVAALALGGCGTNGASSSTGSGEDRQEISFVYSPYADYAPFFLAQDKGYFEKAGVTVKLIPKGGTSGETYQQVSTGNVTAGGASWGAGLFNATEAGATMSVIASVSKVPASGKNPAPFLFRKGSGVETIKDLKGKKVGIPGLGGFGLYSVYLALKSGGLSLKDVELTNISTSDTPAAFANGSVDAAWTIEPMASKLESEGIAEDKLSVDYQAGTELGTLVFNTDFTNQHRDQVVKFTAAYLHAAKELKNGGWDDSANQEIIAKYTSLPVDTLKSIGLTNQDPTGEIDFDNVRLQEDFFRSQGTLDYTGKADLEGIYKKDVLKSAQEEETKIWPGE